MKKFVFLIFTIFIFLSRAVHSEECECNIWPFQPDPPCFNICGADVLSNIRVNNVDNVSNILGLDIKTVQNIATLNSNTSIPQTLQDYLTVLSPEQYKNVELALHSLDQRDFEELLRALER